MKTLNRILAGVVAGFLLGLSIAGMFSALPVDSWMAPLEASARWTALGLSILGVVLVALYVLSAIAYRRSRRLLSFDNAEGAVGISTTAICDYIVKLKAEFPTVVRLVPEVVTGRNEIDVLVGVRIQAGPGMHDACERLQQRVRNRLTTGLGLTQVRRVEVNVMEILPEPKANP